MLNSSQHALRGRIVPILALASALGFASTGCRDEATPTGAVEQIRSRANTSAKSVVERNIEQGRYLPYGQPVPVGEVVDRLPEPYQFTKHGRPAQSGERGIPAQKGRSYPRINVVRHGMGYPAPSGTDAWAGIFLNSDTRGIYGLMDVREDVNIPAGWSGALVYAPTLMPGGGSCVELTTIHWRGSDFGQSFNDGLGIWDWCHQNSFVNFWSFSTTFKNKYVRNVTDEWGNLRAKYYAVVYADNPAGVPYSYDTWRVLLYNYSTGYYDLMLSIEGTGFGLSTGWSMHESQYMQGTYNGGACISLPSIRTIGMNVRRPDGSWTPPTAAIRSYGGVQGGNCWMNSSYTLYIDQYTDGDWWGWTPSNSN